MGILLPAYKKDYKEWRHWTLLSESQNEFLSIAKANGAEIDSSRNIQWYYSGCNVFSSIYVFVDLHSYSAWPIIGNRMTTNTNRWKYIWYNKTCFNSKYLPHSHLKQNSTTARVNLKPIPRRWRSLWYNNIYNNSQTNKQLLCVERCGSASGTTIAAFNEIRSALPVGSGLLRAVSDRLSV